jgi:DNA-binding transcriptional regulator YiaG
MTEVTIESDLPPDILALSRVRRMTTSGEARAIRIGSGLSLSEVARCIGDGVAPSTIWHWEQGDTKPTGSRALAYASVLDGLRAS